MSFTRTGFFSLAVMALAVTGCGGSRMGGGLDEQQPAPLPASPSGQVSQNQLPPPGAVQGPNPNQADASKFPSPPQTASAAPMNNAAAPANAPDITAGGVAGVWSVNVSGQSCRIATPQTKFGQGYRAGPLHCPPPLDTVKSWAVNGKQLALYDQNGTVLARLYSSSANKFDGQTENGQPISLSR
jgi:Protease inhibitor Inh